ncbi:hypothetical protein ACFS7Z_18775 [Pontibacter toksunensis]|uniref:Uncharacterized protein n=1 Tax=Pontibacter toksunensis TaxID=1332631 RepID=A0ABW6BXJ8_9BACT
MRVYNYSTSDIESEMVINALQKCYEKLLTAANKADADGKEYINHAASSYKKLHEKYKAAYEKQALAEVAEATDKLHVA